MPIFPKIMLFPNRRIWESLWVFSSGGKKPPPPHIFKCHFAGRLAHFAFFFGGGGVFQLPETQKELLHPAPNVVATANL